MSRRLLSAAAATALLLGLAACGDEKEGPVTTAPPSIDISSPSDGGGSADPSDGGGTETTTSDPTVTAPDIPAPDPADFAGMDEHTPEGAEQAFRYYIAMTYWARETGNTESLPDLYSDDCVKCADLKTEIDSFADGGDHWVDTSVKDTGTEHFESTNYEVEVGYVYTVSDHVAPGSTSKVPEQEWTGVAGMNWSSGQWGIQEVTLEETGNEV